MQAARPSESPLSRAHSVGQQSHDVRRNAERRCDGRKALVNRFNRGLSADPATGGGESMTRQSFEIHFHSWSQEDIQRILGVFRRKAARDFNHVGVPVDNVFCKQESRRQFVVISRRSHRDGYAPATNTYFQGLFTGKAVAFTKRLLSMAQCHCFCRDRLEVLFCLGGSPSHWGEAEVT